MGKIATLVFVLCTEIVSPGVKAQPTHSDADDWNDKIFASQSFTVDEIRELFSKNPTFAASCVPSTEEFAPYSKDNQNDAKNLWTRFSGELNYPSARRPQYDENIEGKIAFVWKKNGESGFSVMTSFDMSMNGQPYEDLISKNDHILCERDDKRNCRALAGHLETRKYDPKDVVGPEMVEEKNYSKATTEGVFEFFRTAQNPSELMMRIGLNLSVMKTEDRGAGFSIWTDGVHLRHNWVDTKADSFVMRYVCRLIRQ